MSKFKKFQKGDIVELIDNTSPHLLGYRMMVTTMSDEHFSGVCVSVKRDAISHMFVGRICDNSLRYDCWKLIDDRVILQMQPRKLNVGDQIKHIDGGMGIITEMNGDAPQSVAMVAGQHVGHIHNIAVPSEWDVIPAIAIEPRKVEVRIGDTMSDGTYTLMVTGHSEDYFDGVVIETTKDCLGLIYYNQRKSFYSHTPQAGK